MDHKLHLIQMQYEHQHYAELRSIKKLGYWLPNVNDEAEMQIEDEREEREKHRCQLKQELAQLLAQKESDLKRKIVLKNELERMRFQDNEKIAQLMQVRAEGRKLFEIFMKAGWGSQVVLDRLSELDNKSRHL